MGDIRDAANEELRDYETDGVPASGPHEPQKSGLRALFGTIEDAIALAGENGAYILRDTKTLLDADLAHDAGTYALVQFDSTDAQNGYYKKSGASGTGSWTFLGADPRVAAAAAAEAAADDAEGFKDEAEAAAEAAQDIVDGLGSQVPVLLSDETGYIDAFSGLDEDGFTRRRVDYVTTTGRRRGRIDAEALEHPAPVDGEDYIAFQHDPGDGTWQIMTQRKSDGQVFTLTTSGTCVDPKFSADGEHVLYTWADAPEGTPKERYVPVGGGANYAVLSGKRVRRIGDSLTEFNTYGQLVESLGLDWVTSDEGVAFRTPDQIAARVGAIDTILTVSGNSVPSSGTVSVTALSTGNAQGDRGARPTVSPLLRLAGSLPFTWNGKSFLLKTTDGTAYTVEQVGGVGSVSFPAATAVRIDQGDFADAIYLIWAVTNGGLTEPLDTKAQVAAIVASNKAWAPRLIVVGILGYSDGSMNNPSANYTALAALNADLLAAYGASFIDPYKFFRGDAPYNGTTWPSALTLSGLGSFSAEGQDDIADGTWPIDFASGPGDRLHLNQLGSGVLDKLAALMIDSKGWNP